jgi:hypothetical protein
VESNGGRGVDPLRVLDQRISVPLQTKQEVDHQGRERRMSILPDAFKPLLAGSGDQPVQDDIKIRFFLRTDSITTDFATGY